MTDIVDTTAEQELLRLQEIVTRLRSPDGCPWDQEQTSETLIPYLLEEAYEVIESIEEGSQEDLKKELGDLLLHIVLQAHLAEEKAQFKLREAIASINEKLVRRHPHVFGKNTSKAKRVEDATENWEKVKKSEGRESWIEGVPKKLWIITALNHFKLFAEIYFMLNSIPNLIHLFQRGSLNIFPLVAEYFF